MNPVGDRDWLDPQNLPLHMLSICGWHLWFMPFAQCYVINRSMTSKQYYLSGFGLRWFLLSNGIWLP